MKYSDKLNGYWEEGYHYYLEFRDGRLTVRGYRRNVTLETTISYDADAIERGERTVISLADNVLSRDGYGEPFTMIRELAWEDGELKFLYYYTIMGETLYTLKKVDHGPFDHVIIRDGEFLDRLQGDWYEWSESGKGSVMRINGDRLRWHGGEEHAFHVVSYKTSPNAVRIVPADLTEDSFPGFCKFDVLPDMLTTYMIVCDMSMPMTVFARRDMLDKIEVPEAAKVPARNTMMPPEPPMGASPIPTGFMGMGMMAQMPTSVDATKVDVAPFVPVEPDENDEYVCPECGERYGTVPPKFCPNCGTKLRD